jgi:hypothetical protein
MAKQDTALTEALLEAIRRQQSLIDRLLEEVHGGSSSPGLKTDVSLISSRIKALEEKVSAYIAERVEVSKAKTKNARFWVTNIVTWLVTLAGAHQLGHYRVFEKIWNSSSSEATTRSAPPAPSSSPASPVQP